jgi:uncharacterized membrane protein
MPSLPFKTSKKVIVQEILTLALVLLTFVLAFCYYDRLPAQIANHFNFRESPMNSAAGKYSGACRSSVPRSTLFYQ